MAEKQQTGIISYDPATTNSLLEKMYGSRNAFPFDTEAKPESERGITSGAVYAALNELKGATTLNKGYWPDLNTLQTGIPVAEEGSIAYVGGNAPYAVYRWASGGWTDTGQTFTPEVSPGDFYTKQEVDGMRQTLEASVADAAVGANYAVLDYVTSVAVTRMQVPLEVRKAGYMIGYDPGTGFKKEVYIGTSTDNAEWQKDGNWKTELPEQDVAALAEQAQSSAGAAAGSASAASGSAQAAQTAAEEAAGLVQAAQDSIAATETAAQDAITSMQEATGQAVSEAQAAAGNANAAADEANAAAQSANAAAESIGEKQGAGKPLANGSEVFNDLENNSVGNASYAHAEGNVTYAWGDSSHAEGSGGAIKDSKGVTPESSKEDIEAAWQIHQTMTLPNDLFQMAWGENSHAEGKDNLVTGANSHAGGHANKVTGDNNHVSGHQNVVKGKNNVVGGKFHNVEDNPSYGTEGGEGGNLVAGTRCTVKGHGNIASGKWNAGCEVTGSNNAVNGGATVTGDCNAVMTEGGTVTGDHNLAFGNSATIEGSYNMTRGGTAKGNGNIAFSGSVHIGQAYGDCNAAFFGKAGSEDAPVSYTFLAGAGNRSEADYSAAIGNGNTVSGMYAFAAGRDNRASGNSSSSLGAGNVARGDQSVAAGFQSYALGNYAIALGGGAVAVTEEEIAQIESQEEAVRPLSLYALYNSKWAEQEEATGTADSFHMAYGKGSAVTGKDNLAAGNYSSAHGYGTVSYGECQFTVGTFNAPLSSSERVLFCVGNGTANDARSNAFSVYDTGDAYLAGTLSQSSDIRLKDNVKDIEVKGTLRLREWDWKDGRGHSWGFVADEAETLYPEMVSMNANGYKSLDYNAALCAKLAELEKENAELKEENRALRKEFDAFKSAMAEEIGKLKGMMK